MTAWVNGMGRPARPIPPAPRTPLGTCSTCGSDMIRGSRHDDPDWCWPCWVLADRVEGACLALSRVLVWVWCEAEVQADGAAPNLVMDQDRAFWLAQALQLGLLRLGWAR